MIFIIQRFLRSFLEHKNIRKSNSTETSPFLRYLDLKTTTNEQRYQRSSQSLFPKIGNQIHSESHAPLPLQSTGFSYNAFGSPTQMQDKNIFRCIRALSCVSVVLNAFVNRDSVYTLKYILFA